MSAMHHPDDHLFRLGLLLAGGGARMRRAAATAPTGEPLSSFLAAGGLAPAVIDAANRLAVGEARTSLDRAAAAGWRWLVPGDSDYPCLLTSMVDPPLGLFVRGRLSDAPTVAVVGSRKATPYGCQVARLLGEELGRSGVVTVSGMARGVDAEAHRGALMVGGVSWAVWGSGPDRVYPPEHAGLATEISAGGALITEYPPGTPPRRHHFPERNRILAGLSRAVVVVEAAARSGALITARLAMEEGRDVLAVPGNIFSELSVGPNTLIRVGARPLLTPRDLFEAIGVQTPAAAGRVQPADQSWITDGEAVTVDEIAERAGLTVAEVTARVLELELSGELRRLEDGRYMWATATPPETP
jgi:DNA processing protein